MTRSRIGMIQVTVGAVLISFSAVFVKLANVGPTVTGFYRMLFGGILLVIILLTRRECVWSGRRPFLLSLICGLVFALDLTLWHRSIHYVGPGLATILANFQVFFLAAFGVILLREKFEWKLTISILLAVVGLFLMVDIDFGNAEESYRMGVMLGLATATTYATFLLIFRKLQSEAGSRSSFPAIAVISLSAAAIMAPVAAIQGESFGIPDSTSMLVLVSYGLVGQVLGWVFISWGVPKIESSRVGLILLLQPTLAFIWDTLFFARVTTAIEILGGLIALGAIYLGGTAGGDRKPSAT